MSECVPTYLSSFDVLFCDFAIALDSAVDGWRRRKTIVFLACLRIFQHDFGFLSLAHCVIMLNGRWGTHSGNFVVRLLSSLYIHKPSVGPMKSQSLWLLALKHWILLCVYVFVTIRLSTLHIRHSNVKIFSMLHTLVSHAASIRRSCHLHINEKP